jgi:hypothetical protein
MAGSEVNNGQVYQQATSDGAAFKESLDKNGPSATLEKLMETATDVQNNKWTEDQKSIYFNVLTQALKDNKTLPDIGINFLDKEAPRDAAGDIRKSATAVGDKKNLAAEFTAATKSGKPIDVLRSALLRSAMDNFDTFAGAVNDGDTGRISPADLKELLRKQPQRRP